MEYVDVELLGNPPGTAGVGIVGDAFIENAGGRQRQRPVHDVRVPGNPADVGHAPVDILRMDVLVELGGARHIREVATGSMLAAFRLAR